MRRGGRRVMQQSAKLYHTGSTPVHASTYVVKKDNFNILYGQFYKIVHEVPDNQNFGTLYFGVHAEIEDILSYLNEYVNTRVADW
jgi:hypothetical protein